MISNGASDLNDMFHVEQSSLGEDLNAQPDSFDFEPSSQDVIFDETPVNDQVLPEQTPLSTENRQKVDLSGRNTSYNPNNFDVPFVDPNGSVTKALFRDTTTLGAMMYNRANRDIKSPEELGDFNFIDYLKEDMIPFAAQFALDSSEEEMFETEAQIRQEIADDNLLAAHPGKSLLLSIPVQLTDPANFLPFGEVWKSYKAASSITRSMLGAGTSALGAAALQETALQSAQLTRETQESVFNTLSAGILGGALGAAGAGIGKYRMTKPQYQSAHKEITNVMMGDRPSVGAQGVAANEDLANIPDKVKGALKFTARNRLQVSEFPAAQRFAHDLYETNLFQTKNEQGIASSIAVETEMKQFRADYSAVVIEVQNNYFESLGIKANVFKQTRANLKKPDMSYAEYSQAVSYVITSGAPSGNAAVDRGAKILQEKVWGKWTKDLIDLGYLPSDIKPANAVGYFAQVYNQQLIIEQGGARARGPGTFPDALFNDFKQTQNEIRGIKDSAPYKELEKQVKTLKDEKKKFTEKKDKSAVQKKVDIAEKQLLELFSIRHLTSDNKKVRALVDDDMLWNQVDDTVDNILGQADGTLLNPALSLLNSLNPKTLKERHVLADQLSMRPWHKTDALQVTEMVGRALSPFLAMNKAAKARGFNTFSEWRADVEYQLKNEYHAKIAGKTGKEADKITKTYNAIGADIRASIELLEGVYGGSGMNVMSNRPAQFLSNFLAWNTLRLMGGITISSIPDIGNQVIRNGAFQSIYHGLVPMLDSITRGQSLKDLQAMHHVMETAMGVRIKSFSDHQSLVTFPSPFARATDAMIQNFGNLSLVNQWNDFQQFWAGTVSINRTLNTIHNIVEGKKVPKKDRTRVAHLGIKPKDFLYIYDQTKDMISPNGTRTSDWTNWEVVTPEQAQAQRDFVNATGKDIRSIVIEPGAGDKPLSASWTVQGIPVGRAILQFKAFALAATNKITLSAFQRRRDAEVWQGIIALLSFGAASYAIGRAVRGQEVDYEFKNLARESIDRSGLIGILTDVVNIAEKANLLPGENVSRYQSRGVLGAVLGPSVGAIEDVVKSVSTVAGGVKGDDFKAKDIQAFVRLIPFQNLFYLQGLNRVAVGKIAEAFDLEDNR